LGGSFPRAHVGFGSKIQRLEMVKNFLLHLFVRKCNRWRQELLKMLSELVCAGLHPAACLSVCSAIRRITCACDAARNSVTRMGMLLGRKTTGKRGRLKAKGKYQKAKGKRAALIFLLKKWRSHSE
jgi:hypothetical protein